MKAYEVLRKSVIGMIIQGSMIGCGLIAVASALSPATAVAESQEDFDFTNNTGTIITGLYVAAHGTTQNGVGIVSPPRCIQARRDIYRGPKNREYRIGISA